MFWAVPLPDDALRVAQDNRSATLRAQAVPVIDGFQFGGPLAVPATVDFDITWEATADSQTRGMGRQVPATDRAAFLGSFAPARSTGSFSGSALGFSFRSNPTPNTDQTFAQMGTAQNGIFLP